MTAEDPLLVDLQHIAQARQGLVRASDLARNGFAESTLQAVRRRLVRVRRDFYTVASVDDPLSDHLNRLRAALRAANGDWVASHQSAAALHGLPIPEAELELVHVAATAPSPRKSRRGVRHGLHMHPEIVPVQHVAMVDGMPSMTATLAVATAALQLPLIDGLVLADQAGHTRLTSAAALSEVSTQLGRKVGMPKLRSIIAHMDPKSESPGETRTRWLLVSAGFEVESQVVVHDSAGDFVARVDLKIRDKPVVVEFDGRAKFSMNGDTDEAYWRWKTRLDGISNAGLWPVVVTWRDLFEPGRVVSLVDKALARAR